jgi:hypothetical protein
MVDLAGLVITGSWFSGYLIGVRVLEAITVRLRSIRFIKSVHTIAFVPLSALLFVLVYEVAFDRITYLTWTAVAVFLAETVVLMTNDWRCPLTKYAERLGSTHGQITDFFFPKWFADRVFLVYGALFVFSLAVLVVRLAR